MIDRNRKAAEHFERTPIAPECIRVLVQLGERWHWMEMPVGGIWPAMLAFEKEQPKGKKLRRHTDIGTQRASLVMMAADIRNDSEEVCISACWMTFRRRREKESGFEALKCLADAMNEHGAVWLVATGSELAEPESLDFSIMAPWWVPLQPNDAIDMSPKTSEKNIYDRPMKSVTGHH